jgi:transcriptional regulator with XRE-family HTH domain
MTQAELAELAGVGTRLVSEFERGKTSIRIDAANQMLAIFGCAPAARPRTPSEPPA